MASLQVSYNRSASSAGSAENLPPRIVQRVAKELRTLHKSPPEGVKLVLDSSDTSASSLSELVAELEGPVDTPYEGRYFQLKLCLPSDFPASPPKGFFLTKIWHPNVDTGTGAICVNTLKRDWTSSTTLSHVLSVIRCLLIIPFPESSLNDEAGKQFMENYDAYAQRARTMADVHGKSHPCTSYLSEKKANENAQHDVSPIKKTPSVCAAEGVENQIDGNGKQFEGQAVAAKKAKKDTKSVDKSKAKKKKNLKRL
jgi:ubiquitin-conjugating enzyme E2 S